ncbi:MAG: cupin domain-containing protein [Saprospiraceae bacterium]|nr:cupin domain-containing protein [Saprospiraceae bacterium]
MRFHYSSEEIGKAVHQQDGPYTELLRHETLHGGIYVLHAGEADLQQPHAEDEVYYILGGTAQMTVDQEQFSVGTGDLIYVPAHIEHRFFNIERDLQVLIFFSRAPIGQ